MASRHSIDTEIEVRYKELERINRRLNDLRSARLAETEGSILEAVMLIYEKAIQPLNRKLRQSTDRKPKRIINAFSGSITGLIFGILLGTGITYHVSNQRFKENLQNNLSQNVVKAEAIQGQPLTTENITLPEKIAKDEAFIMAYAANIGGQSYRLPITTKEYFKFKQLPHKRKDISDIVNWVTYDNETIRNIAQYMTNDLKSPEAKAQALLDFVHSHMYDSKIEEHEDYVRYPIETIVERNGDCEDFAILGASLMKSIGLDVALILFPSFKGSSHVTLGVSGNFAGRYFNVNEKKYFLAETTCTQWPTRPADWKIGECPLEIISRPARI
jgi:hypothetical protein